MKTITSLFWLRIERMSDVALDLTPGVLLIVGGLLVAALGARP